MLTQKPAALLDTVPVRRSCRRYKPNPLPRTVLDSALDACEDALPLVGAELLVHLVDGEAMHPVLPGLIGMYGKVRAPYWLLVTGRGDDLTRYEEAGFRLEPVVLGMTADGIGTCWIGGSARRDVFRPVADYPDEHVPVILIAFGKPGSWRGQLRYPGAASRLPLEELVLADPGDWRQALDMARLAPSAGNLQPWRFLPDGDRLHAYSKVRVPLQYRMVADHLAEMNRLDVGIALSHVRLALEVRGERAEYSTDGPRRDDMTYIATVSR
jgi:nitroreductase